MDINQEQSSLFGDTIEKNLTNLQLKTKLDAAKKALDLVCAEDTTNLDKKALEFQINRSNFELEQQRSYLAINERAEIDRRIVNTMQAARENISTLLQFFEKGLAKDVPDYDEILNANIQVLKQITLLANACGVIKQTAEVSFHLTESDLKKSLRKTNILEVMRTAKKNGWEVRLTDNEVTLYKNGKLVGGETLKKYFVAIEKGETCSKKTLANPSAKISVQKISVQPQAKAKLIRRKN